MLPTSQTILRIAELRQKARTAEGLILEEMREAIAFLRAERLAMPASTTKPRTTKPAPNAEDLLSELGI